jgi:DNA-binding MltR family transcriptional regulator
MTEDIFEQLNELNVRLHGLNEQGLVLTLAAFADDSLRDLLFAYMFRNTATKKLISGYDAPLGTFSAKINAAFALGLITPGQYSDLNHIRTIRNMFSHTWGQISFENIDVKKHILALNYSNLHLEFPVTLREKLETSTSSLLLELKIAISRITKERDNPIPLGSRIYAGMTGESESNFNLCISKLSEINQNFEAATGEQKRFLTHAKKLWTEKCLRVIAHSSKDKKNLYLLKLFEYVSEEETEFSRLYEGYRH